ncbi:la protein homolog [Scaptodrosophila lebanonensis]|uniref:La protein homolog n=1 Tax=Drosophila lebanonensis TaxID=7225 RepID=A0A6J2U5U1_DROLE|nr:la protein homolog [Scaptodrosophila lebanonensis]
MAAVAEAVNIDAPAEKKRKIEEPTVPEAEVKDKPEAETGKTDAEAGKKDAEADAAPAAGEDKEPELVGEKKERAIIRQVEYYFGDANLNRDKFLREQISKNEDGWVPLTVLVTFKRLAALTTDFEEIINALVKSDEGLLEISDDKQSLRRHPERPIPEHNEERRKEIQERTAYAKGFPLDSQIADILDYFSVYEKVCNITMRKYLDKTTKSYKFKGSIFVTFETLDQAKAFMAKDKVVYKERELLRKWQKEYLQEKQEEYQRKNEKRKNKKESKPEPEIELPKNAIVMFSGALDTTTREELREVFGKTEGFDVAFIEFNKGQTEGAVRLTEADSADKFIEKVENKIKLNDDVSLTLRKATEEEEKEFLDKAIEFMKKRRDFSRNKNKRFGRKRGNDNNYKNKKARGD